jgi:hypothetical protein
LGLEEHLTWNPMKLAKTCLREQAASLRKRAILLDEEPKNTENCKHILLEALMDAHPLSHTSQTKKDKAIQFSFVIWKCLKVNASQMHNSIHHHKQDRL